MRTMLRWARDVIVRQLAREALADEYRRGVQAGAEAAARALAAQHAVDWPRGWVAGAAAGEGVEQ